MDYNSKSLNFFEKKGLVVEEKVITTIGENEMLVKVQSCGICGSDIKILKHGNSRVSSGRTMGHEISGDIVDVGDKIEGYKIGDKVSIGADISSVENLAYGHELDGGFSQYMILNSEHIEIGPIEKFQNINYDIAALAEPLACCLNGYEKVNFRDYDSVLVLGGGVIGIMLSFIAHLKKIPRIYVGDIVKERVKNCGKFNFITKCFDLNDLEIFDWKKDKTGFDLIFTANNSPLSQKQAIELVDKKGVVNFFGGLPNNQGNVEINTNKIHYHEAVITGSHGSNPRQHKESIKIIENNSKFFEKLISKKFAILDFEEAFKEASNPKNLKIMIKPNQNL